MYKKDKIIPVFPSTMSSTLPTTCIKGYHLVLDIDQTLIDSVDLREVTSVFDKPPVTPDVVLFGTIAVYLRPHLLSFLKYCFERFDSVSLWTAGSVGWAYAVSRHLCKRLYDVYQQPYMFHMVWSRERCIQNTTIKPLRKMWRIAYNRNVLGMNSSNTIMVDDLPLNFSKNYGNGMAISPYYATKSLYQRRQYQQQSQDQELYLLQRFFERVLFSDVAVPSEKPNSLSFKNHEQIVPRFLNQTMSWSSSTINQEPVYFDADNDDWINSKRAFSHDPQNDKRAPFSINNKNHAPCLLQTGDVRHIDKKHWRQVASS